MLRFYVEILFIKLQQFLSQRTEKAFLLKQVFGSFGNSEKYWKPEFIFLEIVDSRNAI